MNYYKSSLMIFEEYKYKFILTFWEAWDGGENEKTSISNHTSTALLLQSMEYYSIHARC